MKKIILSIAVAGLVFTTCKKDVGPDEEALELDAAITALGDTIQLPQVINADVTLSPNHLYIIKNKVYVTGGATLTIQAGTRIEGVFNFSTDSTAVLVITKTGKINAKGTQSNPIIFSSHLAGLPGGRTSRLPGDWGGIVMLGDAVTNRVGTVFVPGVPPLQAPPGIDVTYGGTNFNHDGGIMAYVRCEYTGAASAGNVEMNNFTFAGVGKKTVLRFLMATYGEEDAFEFLGGQVPAKFLIANSSAGHAFDFTFGYDGDIQFALAVRSLAFPHNGARGIDSDNPGTVLPQVTRPLLSNFTIIGSGTGTALPGTLNAANFFNGTDLRVRNSIFMGYSTGITFRNTRASNTPLFFRNNIVHAYMIADEYVGPPTVAPWGLDNRGMTGILATNIINTEVPVTHAAWKSNAAVYQSGGQADPATPGSVLPNFVGLTTNFLNVPYIGALGPGSPIRDANGVVIAPNNWVAGTAGAWVDFDPL